MIGRGRGFGRASIAVLVVLALGATVTTASASAARSWRIAGTVLSGSESIQCKIASKTSFTLNSNVGGVNVAISASGFECFVNATITNTGSGGVDSERMEFTGVTVTKPKGCTVGSGTLTTNRLKSTLIEPAADKTNLYDLFAPEFGEELASVVISGGSCAVAGTYPLKGSIAGKGNAWGVETTELPLRFSAGTDSTTGHKLTFAGEAATLEGTYYTYLSNLGGHFGSVFGAF
jgi:hypothetical protein